MKAEFNFEKSMQRLEQIAEMIEDNQLGIDDLTKHLKEAQQLIRKCKAVLTDTDKEIQNLLK